MTTIAQAGVLDRLKDAQQSVAPKIPVDASIGEMLTATNLITFIFFIAGAIFLFNLLNAAWTYVGSSGDSKKIAEGTQRFLSAFYGILVVFASFIIVKIVLAVLGLSGLI